jgi:hypothetical protein
MPDSTQSTALLVFQLSALTRRVERLQVILIGGTLAACAVGAIAFTPRRPAPGADVVTTKRLVLVDAQGKPGATIELGTSPISGDLSGPPGISGAPSLEITIAASRSDSASDSVQRRGAALGLSERALSITFGPISHPFSTPSPRTSGMRLQAGPTLMLTREDQSVYRIDPAPGAARPVGVAR